MVHRKKKQKKINKIFVIGVLIFFGGVGGTLLNYLFIETEELSEIFPEDTAVFSEFSLNKDVAEKFTEITSVTDVNKVINQVFGNKFDLNFEKDLKPWVGKKFGLAVLSKGEIVLAAQTKRRSKTEKFLNKFTVPGEKFIITEIEDNEIWTPAFSSNAAAGFRGKWVFISSSSSAINEIFISEKKLESNEQYRKIRLDTPRKSFFFSYADSAQFVDLFLSGDRFATQKPLFDAGAKTLSSIGFSADVDDKSISVRSKILTADGVFSEHEIKKAANSVMPRLAQFSPKDALFFMNGIDLYAKYAHTKEFLAQFHPQFSVIFEGILRAWGRENFGDKFDFEKDFLAKMRGQYAVLVDFEDEAMPFLDFTLITGFGGVDIEKNLSDFHDAIHFAQSRFTTKVEEVELPDGTVREELVAVDESEIPINKIEFKGRDYFTVENSGSSNSKKLSYGFVENFLVFSTHENGLKSVLSAQATPENALSQNKDFRDSVLFRYSPSESYGFVNFAKLENAINLISNAEIGESGDFSITNLIRKNIRNATFARKVFPGEIFFSATLFAR